MMRLMPPISASASPRRSPRRVSPRRRSARPICRRRAAAAARLAQGGGRRDRLQRRGEPPHRRHARMPCPAAGIVRFGRAAAAAARTAARRGGVDDAGRSGRRPAARGGRGRGARRRPRRSPISRATTAWPGSRSTTAMGRRRVWEPEPVTITPRRDAGARCRTAPSSRRPRTARRPWSRRCARRSAGRRSSPICSPGSAPSPWRSTRKVYAAEGARDVALALKARRARPLRRASRPLPPPARHGGARPVRGGRARSAARRRARSRCRARRLDGAAHRLCVVQSRRPSRATRRCWSRAATGSTGSSRSASSAGRPMSSWRAVSSGRAGAVVATPGRSTLALYALPLEGEGWEGVSGLGGWLRKPNPLTPTLSPPGRGSLERQRGP